jgi:adenylate cyclase
MTDIFISYARQTESHAQHIGDALRKAGYDVWRDDQLPAHRAYGDVIEEYLRSAKAVLVIWSTEAARSQWVRAEADVAREAGTLVQITLDGTIPPLPFNQIQCADLSNWDGDTDAAGWKKVQGSVASLVGDKEEPSPSAAGQRSAKKVSVCVLPFANMSGDAEQEYFSDGISEDIITDLSKVSALSVVARNTAFTYKAKAVDVKEVARELGVSHVLEGSVRKAGERVRITAQLIDGQAGDHVWADRYDRDLTDIFAIQDEISKAIVAALQLKLLPKEKKAIEQRGTTSPEAYSLYLLARQQWVSGNYGDKKRDEVVVRICQQATAVDPNYARAWALMAIAQAELRFWHGREEDGLPAAERALELDPDIAEAYCVKARYLQGEGRFDEANAELAKALELDPESWEVNKEVAHLTFRQGRPADAIPYFEKAAALMENDYHDAAMLMSCYEVAGDRPNLERVARMVVSRTEKAIAQDPSNGAALGMGAGALAALGESKRAKDWTARAMLMDPDNTSMRYNLACAMTQYLGDYDKALDLLEPFFETASITQLRHSDVDPDFNEIRELPRYMEMRAKAGARLGVEA